MPYFAKGSAFLCAGCSRQFAINYGRMGSPRFCSQSCNAEARKLPLAERLSRGLAPPDSNGCLCWTGAKANYGYGLINAGGGRLERTHRLAWRLAYGPIPPGLEVLHACDNPPCGNLAHLFLGTHEDNIGDAVRKGRHCHGERSPEAILSEAQVVAIRARGIEALRDARRYGVARTTVADALYGRTWKHLPGAIAPLKNRGSRSAQAKLTEDIVRAIRLRIESGERQAPLAREYGVTSSVICQVVSRKAWAHVA